MDEVFAIADDPSAAPDRHVLRIDASDHHIAKAREVAGCDDGAAFCDEEGDAGWDDERRDAVVAAIDHCFISCADDGICIKAPRYQEHDDRQAEGVSGDLGPTENVRIRNCTVLTVMNSFKIGTGTFYDVKNIDVEDCTFMLPDIYPGSTSGIAIECADGCTVSDVTVRNIRMDSVCCPIFIMLNRRNCDGFLDAEDEKRRRNGVSRRKRRLWKRRYLKTASVMNAALR